MSCTVGFSALCDLPHLPAFISGTLSTGTQPWWAHDQSQPLAHGADGLYAAAMALWLHLCVYARDQSCKNICTFFFLLARHALLDFSYFTTRALFSCALRSLGPCRAGIHNRIRYYEGGLRALQGSGLPDCVHGRSQDFTLQG